MARKKRIPLSQEELIKMNLERELSDLRDRDFLIPKPTYTFSVGDKVSLGRLEDVVIEEVLDNGKIYLIDYTKVDPNYGNPIRKEHQKSYVNWLDIRKENDNKNSFIRNQDVRFSYSTTKLRTLLTKAYYFGVNFEPEYQRDYVWDQEDKARLIDSIYSNIEIGKFAFIKYSDKKLAEVNCKISYEILDGKQRMRAILDFYEDRFKYNGFYFSELSKIDQNHFEQHKVVTAETEELSKEETLKYFITLNTCGKQMVTEDIQRAENLLKSI